MVSGEMITERSRGGRKRVALVLWLAAITMVVMGVVLSVVAEVPWNRP